MIKKYNINLLLCVLGFLSFGIGDLVSTLAVYNYLNSFEYEAGIVANIAYSVGGINLFMFVKLLLVGICMIVLYWLIKTNQNLKFSGYAAYLNIILIGIGVSVSNFNIIFNGYSISLFSLDITQLVYGISIIFCLIVLGILFFYTPITKVNLEK
jgi:hypothetical protein